MDKKQQKTFERDTTWQDARTQSIKCQVYRLPQYYDSDWQSSHDIVSPLLYYVCTRWDTQKKTKSAWLPKEQEINSVY